MKGGRNL
jgi:hypothetical protein